MGLIGRAKIISLINLKGGVGKTTSAVNIAATLADRENKEYKDKEGQRNRVLLIDLDPQSNASLTLLNRSQYANLDNKDETIFSLFCHEINSNNDTVETFDLNKIRQIRPINSLNLDLIPSSLKLMDIQDKLVTFRRYYISATDILYNALEKLRQTINKKKEEKQYDYIIIDCPPSLGLITLNGLLISDYYLVPTLLDSYSHWGLNKIVDKVNQLKKCKASSPVELLGIFYSKVDNTATKQNTIWNNEFKKWLTENEIHSDKIFNLKLKNDKNDVVGIDDKDIIRKAETDHKPLIVYARTDDVQKRYDKLVEEIIKRIYPKNPQEESKISDSSFPVGIHTKSLQSIKTQTRNLNHFFNPKP